MKTTPALYSEKNTIQFGPSGNFLTLTEMACSYYELKRECEKLKTENAELKKKKAEACDALIAAERRENDLIDRMREGL
ncbi:hypothetical protein EBZ39_14400 [bacterium]|nr:hypothetical protein [bacterium]